MKLGKVCLFIATMAANIERVQCSGSLYDPPNRAVMWKYGFNTEKNYNYMQLNCGGEKQFENGPFKCGVCGDPPERAKDHELGGRYGSATISQYYPAGIKEMTVKVELLAFERGFFEFRICAANNNSVTQECLDENLLPIKEGYLAGTPMRFYPKSAGDFRLTVAVPPNLVCDRCVLQWRYHTANNWGTDSESGSQGLGYGPQEEFRNCADIRIGGEIPTSVLENPFFAPPDGRSVSGAIDKPTDQRKNLESSNATVLPTAVAPQNGVGRRLNGAEASLQESTITGHTTSKDTWVDTAQTDGLDKMLLAVPDIQQNSVGGLVENNTMMTGEGGTQQIDKQGTNLSSGTLSKTLFGTSSFGGKSAGKQMSRLEMSSEDNVGLNSIDLSMKINGNFAKDNMLLDEGNTEGQQFISAIMQGKGAHDSLSGVTRSEPTVRLGQGQKLALSFLISADQSNIASNKTGSALTSLADRISEKASSGNEARGIQLSSVTSGEQAVQTGLIMPDIVVSGPVSEHSEKSRDTSITAGTSNNAHTFEAGKQSVTNLQADLTASETQAKSAEGTDRKSKAINSVTTNEIEKDLSTGVRHVGLADEIALSEGSKLNILDLHGGKINTVNSNIAADLGINVNSAVLNSAQIVGNVNAASGVDSIQTTLDGSFGSRETGRDVIPSERSRIENGATLDVSLHKSSEKTTDHGSAELGLDGNKVNEPAITISAFTPRTGRQRIFLLRASRRPNDMFASESLQPIIQVTKLPIISLLPKENTNLSEKISSVDLTSVGKFEEVSNEVKSDVKANLLSIKSDLEASEVIDPLSKQIAISNVQTNDTVTSNSSNSTVDTLDEISAFDESNVKDIDTFRHELVQDSLKQGKPPIQSAKKDTAAQNSSTAATAAAIDSTISDLLKEAQAILSSTAKLTSEKTSDTGAKQSDSGIGLNIDALLGAVQERADTALITNDANTSQQESKKPTLSEVTNNQNLDTKHLFDTNHISGQLDMNNQKVQMSDFKAMKIPPVKNTHRFPIDKSVDMSIGAQRNVHTVMETNSDGLNSRASDFGNVRNGNVGSHGVIVIQGEGRHISIGGQNSAENQVPDSLRLSNDPYTADSSTDLGTFSQIGFQNSISDSFAMDHMGSGSTSVEKPMIETSGDGFTIATSGSENVVLTDQALNFGIDLSNSAATEHIGNIDNSSNVFGPEITSHDPFEQNVQLDSVSNSNSPNTAGNKFLHEGMTLGGQIIDLSGEPSVRASAGSSSRVDVGAGRTNGISGFRSMGRGSFDQSAAHQVGLLSVPTQHDTSRQSFMNFQTATDHSGFTGMGTSETTSGSRVISDNNVMARAIESSRAGLGSTADEVNIEQQLNSFNLGSIPQTDIFGSGLHMTGIGTTDLAFVPRDTSAMERTDANTDLLTSGADRRVMSREDRMRGMIRGGFGSDVISRTENSLRPTINPNTGVEQTVSVVSGSGDGGVGDRRERRIERLMIRRRDGTVSGPEYVLDSTGQVGGSIINGDVGHPSVKQQTVVREIPGRSGFLGGASSQVDQGGSSWQGRSIGDRISLDFGFDGSLGDLSGSGLDMGAAFTGGGEFAMETGVGGARVLEPAERPGREDFTSERRGRSDTFFRGGESLGSVETLPVVRVVPRRDRGGVDSGMRTSRRSGETSSDDRRSGGRSVTSPRFVPFGASLPRAGMFGAFPAISPDFGAIRSGLGTVLPGGMPTMFRPMGFGPGFI